MVDWRRKLLGRMANCAAQGSDSSSLSCPPCWGGPSTAGQGLAVPKLPVESSTPSPGTHSLGKANISVTLSSQKMMC